MGAPNGEWKSVAAGYFVILSIAFWFMVIIKKIGESLAVFIITSPITIITSPITIITSVFIIDYFS